MAFTPHVLVSFGGSPTAFPREVWECSVRGIMVTGGPDPTDFDADAYLAAVGPLLIDWYVDSDNNMRTDMYLEWIKANAIGADGKYINPVSHTLDLSPQVGTFSPGNQPGFCSFAYTWETGIARGRAHRGRMYPPNGYTMLNSYEISSANALAASQSASLLLSHLDNQASGESTQELVFGIYSRIDGTHHDIIGASADNIVDVQRRRKNRVDGTRSPVYPYAHP